MKKIIIFAVLAFMAPMTYAEGNAANGKDLAGTCLACHGEIGNSPASMFPNIAGQNAQYLLKQLLEIQSGQRQVLTMTGILDNLSESDLSDIAAYYESQSRNQGTAKQDLVELGESIYRAGIPRKNIAACTACHSPTGNGNGPAVFPALAGQWPEYTVTQLKNFQSGERHNDGDSQMMRTTAMDMNEKEMTAVASYLYGLR
jgi:cytochrome c553|tara:strand:- start:289 stop:891 length:603 start_codon:yes stop_codon:yes gene_type:complete